MGNVVLLYFQDVNVIKTRLGHLALRDLMESRLTARTTKKYQHTTLYDICYFQTLDLRRESDNEF